MALLESIGSFFSAGADRAAEEAAAVLAANARKREAAAGEFETRALGELDTALTGARGELTGARDTALDALGGSEAGATARLDPFAQGGGQAVNQLLALLGIGPAGQDPNAILANTPGFQFARDQGVQAVDRSAAARGSLNSGGTLKALTRFGQGLAGQTFANQINALLQLSGLGQQAAGSQASIESQGGANRANVITGAGTNIANALLGSGANRANVLGTGLGARTNALEALGQARAGGIVGAANARQAGLQNVLTLGGRIAGAFV